MMRLENGVLKVPWKCSVCGRGGEVTCGAKRPQSFILECIRDAHRLSKSDCAASAVKLKSDTGAVIEVAAEAA